MPSGEEGFAQDEDDEEAPCRERLGEVTYWRHWCVRGVPAAVSSTVEGLKLLPLLREKLKKSIQSEL